MTSHPYTESKQKGSWYGETRRILRGGDKQGT